jgi:hypothetical protein
MLIYRNSRIGIPFLKVFELLQAQKLPELVHGANTPLASLKNAHDLNHSQHTRSSPSTVGTGRTLSCVEQNLRNIVVGELSIWTTFQSGWNVKIVKMRGMGRTKNNTNPPKVRLLGFGSIAAKVWPKAALKP